MMNITLNSNGIQTNILRSRKHHGFTVVFTSSGKTTPSTGDCSAWQLLELQFPSQISDQMDPNHVYLFYSLLIKFSKHSRHFFLTYIFFILANTFMQIKLTFNCH